MTRQFARMKRNDALNQARAFARRENFHMMEAWIERAAKYEPLTEMQLWRIKMLIGRAQFSDMNLDRFASADANPLGTAQLSTRAHPGGI